MGDVIQSEAEELARAAQAFVDGSQDLAVAVQRFRSDADLQVEDFGDVDPAGALHHAHTKALADAGSALERLVAVIEEGADNLFQTAFFYQHADDSARRRLEQLRGRPGPGEVR